MEYLHLPVNISRFNNPHTKPRLYSPLFNYVGPIRGFRFRINPYMNKEEIIEECERHSERVKFDPRPEVNAVLFISSIVVGWAYRVVITKEFYCDRYTNGVLVHVLLPMIHTLLEDESVKKIKKHVAGDDGWTRVVRVKRVNKEISAHTYCEDVLENHVKRGVWDGIFDINLQVVLLAIVRGDKEAIDMACKRYHSRLRRKDMFKREVNKFKIFQFLVSFY